MTNSILAPAGETEKYLDPDQSEDEEVGGNEGEPAPAEQPEGDGDVQVSEDTTEKHADEEHKVETDDSAVIDENDLQLVCHYLEFVACH